MVRVPKKPASARNGPRNGIKKKSQKHKVILESVTQEKKKLCSVVWLPGRIPVGVAIDTRTVIL